MHDDAEPLPDGLDGCNCGDSWILFAELKDPEARLFVLRRYELENYLLEPEAVAEELLHNVGVARAPAPDAVEKQLVSMCEQVGILAAADRLLNDHGQELQVVTAWCSLTVMRALPVLIWMVGVATAGAQGLSTSIVQVSTDGFPEVRLALTVFSEDGHPVPGLTRDAFTLTEDGAKVALRTVDVSKQPISIALALDASSVIAPALDAIKDAARAFVRGLEDGDTVAVVTFGDAAKVVQERTQDRQKVMAAIDRIQPAGSTALFDAIDSGLDEIRPVDRRRLVLVLTGGRDRNAAGTGPQSAHSAKSVAKASRDLHIPIWVIGVGPDPDRELLTKLAKATGGASYFAGNAGTIRDAFTGALTDVRLSYQMAYASPKTARDGSERTVAITSATRGKTGQGSATYRAPLPEPKPEPTPVAAGEGGEDATVVHSQLAKISLSGFEIGANIWCYPAALDYASAEKAKQVSHVLYGVTHAFVLSPGKYKVVQFSDENEIVLAVVELKAGAHLDLKAP